MEAKKLIVKDLEMQYDGKCALNKVSFDVRDGAFLSIPGTSGCGKTRILRILIALLKPTSRSVIKNGIDITALPPSARSIGIVSLLLSMVIISAIFIPLLRMFTYMDVQRIQKVQ